MELGKPEPEKESVIVSKYDQPGYWIGIQIDPKSRKLIGGTTPLLPALVEGY